MEKAYTSESFTIFADSGHAWLKISSLIIEREGLSPALDFSQYSYWKRDSKGELYLYLEEDCDAGVFLATYYGNHKAMPRVKTRHCNGQSKIRGFNHLPRGERFDANMAEAAKVWREMRESEAA